MIDPLRAMILRLLNAEDEDGVMPADLDEATELANTLPWSESRNVLDEMLGELKRSGCLSARTYYDGRHQLTPDREER